MLRNLVENNAYRVLAAGSKPAERSLINPCAKVSRLNLPRDMPKVSSGECASIGKTV